MCLPLDAFKSASFSADALDVEASTLPVQVKPLPPAAHERGTRVEELAPSSEHLRVEDFDRVEDYLRAYLADQRFRSAYPAAYERWSEAATMLYGAGSKEGILAAGRKAREAIQEFARILADSRGGAVSTPDSAGAEADLLSSLIETYRPQLAESRCELLKSLLAYWRGLEEAVHRHERPAQDAGEPLRWEDGRRIVVFTALVMVEVDRSL